MKDKTPIPHALLWDLDETMGQFKPAWLESLGHVLPPEIKKRGGIRYGLPELLEEFSAENGYVHFVTTAASTEYADTVLERTNLRPYFKEIYGRGTVVPENKHDRGVGKYYQHIASKHGYTGEDVADKMLAIGNTPEDQPLDVKDMVFLELAPTWRMDALVIREVITTVLENGDGSFSKGFKTLYETAQTASDNPDAQVVHHINDEIQFRMEYRPAPQMDGTQIPVITDVIAPTYIKPGVIV